MKTHNRFHFARLPLLALAVASIATPALAQNDPPAIANEFKGAVQGKVNWVHSSNTWLMLWPTEFMPDKGDAGKFDELKGLKNGLKVGIEWWGAGKPNPKMVEFLQDLKPGQQVKFDLMPGYGNKGVRLAQLPAAEPSAAKADDEKPKVAKRGPDLLEYDVDKQAPFARVSRGWKTEKEQGNFGGFKWALGAWDADSRVELKGEAEEDKKFLRLTNLKGKPALMFFRDKLGSVEKGQTVVAEFEYRTAGQSSFAIEIGKQKKQWSLPASKTWKKVSYTLEADQNGPLKVDWRNNAMGKANALSLRPLYVGVAGDTVIAAAPKAKGPEFITPPRLKVQAPFQNVDLTKATGARIDENAIQTVLMVDAAAKTGGDGSAARPFAAFGDAYQSATALLKKGVPVKISLAAGVYREGDFEMGFPDDETARATPLVIEGAPEGGTIFSGADVFSDWKDEGNGVYSTAWSHEFGFHAGLMGQNNVMGLLGQRREMVFVNGKWLHPVILEETDYTLQKLDKVKTVAGQHGGGLATDPIGTWTYQKLRDPKSALFDGSFGVTERKENGKRLYLKLAGGAAPTGQQIEATTRKQWARIVYKDNIVLRNLTVQHYGSPLFADEGWARKAALQFGKPGAPGPQFALCKNVAIENVRVDWNAGAGFSLDDITGLTVRNVTANYNGGGNGIGSIVNMNWQDVETNFNNWRGKLGNKLNWAIAGTKFHMFRDALIARHESVGNLSSGIWMDINCENFAVEDATVIENRTGVFFEISKGPMALRRSLIADNGVNVRLVASENVALEDNLIYQTSGSKKVAEEMDGDTGQLVRKLNSGITFHHYNRSSMNNQAQWDVFGTELFGRPKTHRDFWLPGPVKAQDNVIVTGDDAYPLFFQLWIPPEARNAEIYQKAWQGRDNVYYSTNTREALFTDYDKPETSAERLSRIGLDDWEKRFNEKAGARMAPGFRDAENYDFRLQAGDPLQARKAVPFKQLDEKTLQELRAWEKFVASLRPYESGK